MSDRPLLKFSWANVALLLLVMTLLITGYFGMTNGRFPVAWLLWLHGMAAYGVLVLLLWKGAIIVDAFRRKRRWTWSRVGFAGMLALLLLTLLCGLLWTFAGPIYVGGFSLVSIHIYLAIPLALLLVWHTRRMRFGFRLPQTWGRRLFLGTAVSALGGGLLWRSADWVKAQWRLPGAARRFTGSYERDSFSNRFPSVSWIADRPSPVDVAAWELVIAGAVARPLRLRYEELAARPQQRVEAVLDCTGGWYARQQWEGVRLADLLAEAGVLADAASVTIEAVSGYKRRFPLDEAAHFLLALHVAEAPLRHGHGFPLRLVAPTRRGYDWVKWVARIQVNRSSAIWQSPLPLQ